MNTTTTIKCDRCNKTVDGVICINSLGEKTTAGFYNVHDGYWARFAKSWGEKMICDDCMHSDPIYQEVYKLPHKSI